MGAMAFLPGGKPHQVRSRKGPASPAVRCSNFEHLQAERPSRNPRYLLRLM